jgi:hypothetical protein
MQVRSVLEEAGLDPDAMVEPAVIAGDKEEREAILNGLAGMLHRLHVALGKEAAAVEREMKEVVEEMMGVPMETESTEEEKEVENVVTAVPMQMECTEEEKEVEEGMMAVLMEMESTEEGKAESELTEEQATGVAGPMEAHNARTQRLARVHQWLGLMRAWAEADPEAWGGAAEDGERAVISFRDEFLAYRMNLLVCDSYVYIFRAHVLVSATHLLLGLLPLGEGVCGGAGARGTGKGNNRILLPRSTAQRSTAGGGRA